LSLAFLMAACLDILLMVDLIMFNLETNTVVESYDMIFGETTPLSS
jgi:hypothetical protein